MNVSRHFYAIGALVTLLTASGLSASHIHTSAAASTPLPKLSVPYFARISAGSLLRSNAFLVLSARSTSSAC